MDNPFKSYSDLQTEIELYGDSPKDLGNIPNALKDDKVISDITPNVYNYEYVNNVAISLIRDLNILKNVYERNCTTGIDVTKCQKKRNACNIIISNLSAISQVTSKPLKTQTKITPKRGGSRRKTMKGRRKNKSRRNRKSRR